MQSSVSLLLIGILALSPLCWAYSDADLEADKLRISELIRTSDNEDAKIRNTQELLEIYRRISHLYTPEQRAGVEELIGKHTEPTLIDGVPVQGGWMNKYMRKAAVSFGKEVAVSLFVEFSGSMLGLINGRKKQNKG